MATVRTIKVQAKNQKGRRLRDAERRGKREEKGPGKKEVEGVYLLDFFRSSRKGDGGKATGGGEGTFERPIEGGETTEGKELL